VVSETLGFRLDDFSRINPSICLDRSECNVFTRSAIFDSRVVINRVFEVVVKAGDSCTGGS
jgi:hypothetical protein